MINIFNNEPEEYSCEASKILASFGNYTLDVDPAEVDAIITRLRTQINNQFLDYYPNLKYILTATTGLNHIDLEECNNRNIQVISLRGETEFLSNIAATAEHTIGLMLSLLRHIPSAHSDVLHQNWDRMNFKGNELKGRTLSILGLGRLGIQVANIAHAFGMEIKSFDKTVSPIHKTTNNLVHAVQGSDIVSVHLPYNHETHHLLTTSVLMETNPGSYLINTARGEIIKEDDLVECLENKHLAGAAVDVLENEYSLNSSPLLQYSMKNENVIITPHIGGCTHESMAATEVFIANKFKTIYLGS
ncbi:MAG: hypothetical protein CL763_06815 [Chloroflexi bacterium]|nr:hypothetical protein [Chloroflexota bacterium]|tara:strand:+ start:8013 stop:8921 length:909 start_codon:yes stop_codon:yes gene_type:complete